MKFFLILLLLSSASPLLCRGAALVFRDVATGTAKRAQPQGIDVSHFQATVNWVSVKANGVSFVYIKATEGTSSSSTIFMAPAYLTSSLSIAFLDPTFSSKYEGATTAGLIRGAYHFAHPDSSSGATQANYFLAHGGRRFHFISLIRRLSYLGHAGGWSGDGITLPGALDIECLPLSPISSASPWTYIIITDNPSGAECYGLSASAMVSWISDFSSTYHAATTRYPVIYTTTDWWTTCTGNSAAFASNNPLWIAHYSSSIGTLPAGWSFTTFWQYADSGPNPGDQDSFNGDAAGLKR
ncbi:Secreted hydrolase [Mycena venus]|uniref:Secreted hydrolase n=1 Tax=Mycena venus TaxID=2733690 RepID=A0A8H6YJC5_9AGAR|nr:Secreted hydrolase [Mycena venus]